MFFWGRGAQCASPTWVGVQVVESPTCGNSGWQNAIPTRGIQTEFAM